MRYLLLLLLTGCSVTQVPISREINVRLSSELDEERTRRIYGISEGYLRQAGIRTVVQESCSDCLYIGIKIKPFWRSLIGLQGWYSQGTILIYAGLSDTYTGKVLAHEIGHALGCEHEALGLMHQPWTSGWLIPGVDGIDLATGFSENCARIMRGEQ